MAIAVPAVSAGVSTTDGSNVTVTLPTASMTAGDWIYLFGGHFYRAGVSIGPTSGSWEQLYSENAGGSTNACGLWRKKWDGAETQVVCYGSGNAADGSGYVRTIVRGSDVVRNVSSPATGTTGAPNAPAATVTAGLGDAVLIFAQSAVSDTSKGTISGYTLADTNANASTNDMSTACGYKLAPTTNDDPAAWSAWSNGNWRAITVVLQMGLNASNFDVPAPELGSPTLNILVTLAAMSLAVSAPEFGTPVLTTGLAPKDFTANNFATAMPEFGTPVLTQRHVLVAQALETPLPVFAAASLQRIVNLLASNLAAPAPIFDTPALGQKHVLIATILDAGAPVFSLPSLGGSVYLLIGDAAIDNGLAEFADADCIHVCSQLPISYADVGAYTLGHKDFAIGTAFTAPEEITGGRAVTSTAIANGDVTAEGTPICWAVTDEGNSRFLGAGPMDGGILVHVGQKFTLQSFTINRANE